MNYKKVLVTGGSGFLGRRLQKFRPDWIYVSSRQYDLTSLAQAELMLLEYSPDAVIHLAARVGGVKDNVENQGEFLYKNVYMNTNVLEACRRVGIKRVLSSLSTCAFPDVVEKYPFTEKNLFDGKPAESNFSYGYSKRLLQVQSLSYRNQYNLNYSTFCPSNLYGPEDHFGKESSHFVAALVTKLFNAQEQQSIEMWGTGLPLRQQLFVDDLCEIIPILLEKHNTDIPIIVAPDENLSIKKMCLTASKSINKNVNFIFNNKMDGQFRKDGSNEELKKIIGNYNFTKFDEGFKKTFYFYENIKE